MKGMGLVITCLVGLLAGSAFAQDRPGTVERLYVIECGQGRAPDQSRWSPGVNEGKPFDMVTNCYLIKHAQGYMLWEAGVGDTFASLAEGRPGSQGGPTWRLAKTMLAQLDEIGVRPADVKVLAVSHTHGDHIGNVEMFPKAMLLVQKAEYDWPTPFGIPRFKPEHPVTKLEGDRDVFGDGSVTLIATPGAHARTSIDPDQAAEDRRAPHHRRRGAFPGELGCPAGAGFQRRQGAVARLHAAHRGPGGPAPGAALDPPRQAAERRAEEGAGLLRLKTGRPRFA
jgi:hypothetical protein